MWFSGLGCRGPKPYALKNRRPQPAKQQTPQALNHNLKPTKAPKNPLENPALNSHTVIPVEGCVEWFFAVEAVGASVPRSFWLHSMGANSEP